MNLNRITRVELGAALAALALALIAGGYLAITDIRWRSDVLWHQWREDCVPYDCYARGGGSGGGTSGGGV